MFKFGMAQMQIFVQKKTNSKFGTICIILGNLKLEFQKTIVIFDANTVQLFQNAKFRVKQTKFKFRIKNCPIRVFLS